MKKNLTVLGIHNFHDSGAALVRNGEILAAINEERITNQKHASGYPLKSIEEVYNIAKIDPSETDAIAVVGTADLRFSKHFQRFPDFSDSNSNQQERFINLIDVLYDHQINLIMSSERKVDDLNSAYYLKDRFIRTKSRLSEMKSKNYRN